MIRRKIQSLLRFFREKLNHQPAVGIAWYREEEWPILKTLASDTAHLEKTYADWQRVAESRYNTLAEKGAPVQKITVDVRDMAAWCREMGRPMDSEGRAAYMVYRLQVERRA